MLTTYRGRTVCIHTGPSKSLLTETSTRASHFSVPHAFLLQQAAWLYERHLSHVRAQMRKMAPATASSTASPPQVAVSGSVAMKRRGSAGSRAPSAMSLRARDSPLPRTAEGSIPGTPRAPVLSRNPSTATVTQSRQVQERAAVERSGGAPSPRQPPQRSFRSSFPPPAAKKQETPPGSTDTTQRKLSNITAVPTTASPADSLPASPESSESSSSSSDDAAAGPPGIRRSQIFRRGPHFKAKKTPLDTVTDYSQQDEDEDDEDEEYLPFAAAAADKVPSSKTSGKQRQEAGSKGDEGRENSSPKGVVRGVQASRGTKGKAPQVDANMQITSPTESSSSVSSAPQRGNNNRSPNANTQRALGQLSPRHRAELARLSPRRTKTGESQGQGSEGTPSMGSSFSDLDGSWGFLESPCRSSYSVSSKPDKEQ